MPVQPLYYTSLFLLALLSGLSSLTAQTGNRLQDEDRTVESFRALSVSSDIHVFISRDENRAVRVRARQNTLPRVITEVVEGELRIRLDKWEVGLGQVDVFVSLPELNALTVSGGSKVEGSEEFETEKIAIIGSGGSRISLRLQVSELVCQSSGGAEIELEGRAGRATLSASGGSELRAGKLKAEQALVVASGGADIYVYAVESLMAEASGGADIFYLGDPSEKRFSSGRSASISRY